MNDRYRNWLTSKYDEALATWSHTLASHDDPEQFYNDLMKQLDDEWHHHPAESEGRRIRSLAMLGLASVWLSMLDRYKSLES